jgi:hypothetical protein
MTRPVTTASLCVVTRSSRETWSGWHPLPDAYSAAGASHVVLALNSGNVDALEEVIQQVASCSRAGS